MELNFFSLRPLEKSKTLQLLATSTHPFSEPQVQQPIAINFFPWKKEKKTKKIEIETSDSSNYQNAAHNYQNAYS